MKFWFPLSLMVLCLSSSAFGIEVRCESYFNYACQTRVAQDSLKNIHSRMLEPLPHIIETQALSLPKDLTILFSRKSHGYNLGGEKHSISILKTDKILKSVHREVFYDFMPDMEVLVLDYEEEGFKVQCWTVDSTMEIPPTTL